MENSSQFSQTTLFPPRLAMLDYEKLPRAASKSHKREVHHAGVPAVGLYIVAQSLHVFHGPPEGLGSQLLGSTCESHSTIVVPFIAKRGTTTLVSDPAINIHSVSFFCPGVLVRFWGENGLKLGHKFGEGGNGGVPHGFAGSACRLMRYCIPDEVAHGIHLVVVSYAPHLE